MRAAASTCPSRRCLRMAVLETTTPSTTTGAIDSTSKPRRLPRSASVFTSPAWRCQKRKCVGGAKHFRRMRIKRQNGSDAILLAGALQHAAKDLLVAEVQAIEIADGQRCLTAAGGKAREPLVRREDLFHARQISTG